MSKPRKRQSVHGVQGWPSAVPDSFHILIDTREQNGWDFSSFKSVTTSRETVRFGDYCLQMDPTLAAVERKSLADFVMCMGRERKRFTAQVAKLVGAVHRPLLIVEADYSHMEIGGWRGRMTPPQVLAGLHHFLSEGVPILLCRSRGEAERACFRHLYGAFSSRYKEAREFARRLQS